MSDPKLETMPHYPFTAFNFDVEIDGVPGVAGKVCGAAFAECDGIEMTMDVKTIREGGNNGRQIRFAGPLGFGQLTLKRGMTASRDLWRWAKESMANPSLRVDVHVVMNDSHPGTPRVCFVLSRCIPVKLKAPALNAKDGMVAIEEMQIAYESMSIEE